jgi:signal transduction histidine kinase
VEQTDLCRALVRLIADTVHTLPVSLWLVDDKQGRLILAASTSLSETKSHDLSPPAEDAAAAIRHFQGNHEPIDIESAAENWAVALRRCHPGEFPDIGGHRVCVPIVGRGEVLGLIIVGDRVGGVPFSLQDFDMLKCVADHAAASLLNTQLSQRLLQARELEAFQTMAAFFVHDLKNSASTLNLMLQNLPVHFNDPAFREDALRGVSKTVAHINHLIGRLSLLRHEMTIQPVEADLNEVVARAIADSGKAADPTLATDLRPMSKVFLDPDQILKVVTNLVLNATEAVAQDGQVRIATSHQGGWAVVSVADNGCGMSAEFISRSLFRPFQTTK